MKNEISLSAEDGKNSPAVFGKNLAGLHELEIAYNEAKTEEKEYAAKFEWMLNNGECIFPKHFVRPLREMFIVLSKKFPRAAVYIIAYECSQAFNGYKSRAGRKAMTLLINGGELLRARKILSKYLLSEAAFIERGRGVNL